MTTRAFVCEHSKGLDDESCRDTEHVVIVKICPWPCFNFDNPKPCFVTEKSHVKW